MDDDELGTRGVVQPPAGLPARGGFAGPHIAGANDSALRLYSANGTLLNDRFALARANTIMARGPGGFWGTEVYFIGTNWNLMRLNTNGVVAQVGTTFGGLNCFAFGPDGALYASQLDNDLIWRIAPVEERPRLAIFQAESVARLTWTSVTNRSYQLQAAPSLPAVSWADEGLPFAGTGGVLATNIPVGPEQRKFFRLQIGN